MHTKICIYIYIYIYIYKCVCVYVKTHRAVISSGHEPPPRVVEGHARHLYILNYLYIFHLKNRVLRNSHPLACVKMVYRCLKFKH